MLLAVKFVVVAVTVVDDDDGNMESSHDFKNKKYGNHTTGSSLVNKSVSVRIVAENFGSRVPVRWRCECQSRVTRKLWQRKHPLSYYGGL
jgi:hypothetical protein